MTTTRDDALASARSEDQPVPQKRLGRPPLSPDQRTDAKPRTIRLGDERWAKLQRLGREWLERQIDKARE